MNTRGKRRSSRARDHRQDDLHSQKRGRSVSPTPACQPDRSALSTHDTPVVLETPRPNPPKSTEELPSDSSTSHDLEQRDIRDIARLNVLTTKKHSGSLSAPVILHTLEITVGNKSIMSYLSLICVSLDQQLGERSLDLSAEVGSLPKFRKKASKKEHAILLLALYSVFFESGEDNC